MSNYNKEPLSKAQLAAATHYARQDIQQAMFDFCKHRETVANFNNKFFAKRPDTFDYTSDIINQARQGATSFHCSEEIWENPLDINTDMTPEQYNKLRIGWDLLIDIDSPFLDYGKIAARLLMEQLEEHGVKNYGIKFSGSKGFHILVPFKSFPEEVDGEQTKDNFPEWPRLIAGYLFKEIKEEMHQEILKLTNREKLKETGELISEHICPKCGNSAAKKEIGKYKCIDIKCKTEVESMKSNRKEMICPSCNGKMERTELKEIYFCEPCKVSSVKLESVGMRGDKATLERELEIEKKFAGSGIYSKRAKLEESTESAKSAVDVILVSSRHLFRAPYSLHEKTAFASIVIDKEQVQNFKPTDADPLKITNPKSFMPDCEAEEAKELLIRALDWGRANAPKEKPKKFEGASLDMKGLTITEDMFPPIIKIILKGIPQDGRKRALGLLLSFFTSLEFPQEFIEEKIEEWNKKNYQPLKQGYVKSQIAWSLKNKRLPPNYDKPIYKEFGIRNPPEPGMKNPLSYTIKKAMRARAKGSYSEKDYDVPKSLREI